MDTQVAMAYSLPEELLAEILKRLPVKSLLRSMCVQQSWYHLIRSPYFINLLYHHPENKTKYLLFRDRYRSRLSLRFDDKKCKEFCSLPCRTPAYNKKYQIYGTSRGLICFSTSEHRLEKAYISNDRLEKVHLWNPVIGKFKTLPETPMPPSDDPFCGRPVVGLAFGYLPSISDYNVIAIQNYAVKRGRPCSKYNYVCVYSLSTNSWKTVSSHQFAGLSGYRLYNSVVVNGGAYWVGIKENPLMKAIVCLDIVVKETIREIMLPPQYSNTRNYINLVPDFGGSLTLFYVDMVTLINDIWILETDDVWTKKFTLDLNKLPHTLEYWPWPIGLGNKGEILHLLYGGRCDFWSYDLEKEEGTEMVDDSLWLSQFRDLKPYDYCEEYLQPMYVNVFEESLALLGMKDEVDDLPEDYFPRVC